MSKVIVSNAAAASDINNELVNMEKSQQNVVHIPITIPEEELNQGALKVLAVIRPQWKQQDIDFKLLTDGITNKLVAGFLRQDVNKSDVVLVRIYGNKTDLLIDRKAETRNIILLHNANLAPSLYATFENGLSYEYVPGNTLTEEMVQDPKIYKLVAARLAQMHKVKIPEKNVEPMLWNKMNSFYKLIPDKLTDPIKQQKFNDFGITKTRILEEMNFLKSELDKIDNPIVFCHNDLLLGNAIYNAERNNVTFIDFEYSGYNYQAFDIGNHFAEFVGINVIDYAKYPKEEVQKSWLRNYLAEFLKNGVSPDTIDEQAIDKLYTEVNKFCLAAHMLWSLWSLIQAEHSYLDFDFISYFVIRFTEYLKKRDEFLSMQCKHTSKQMNGHHKQNEGEE